MRYHEWHERPGYYGDITRHFDRDARVLDVGCSTGWLSTEFTDYVGVDIDAAAVEAAVATGVNAVVGRADGTLAFADESFDAVILKDVLEHLIDPVAMVREVHRVLRTGGLVFASSPDAQRTVWHDYTHIRPYTKRSMGRLFQDNDFEIRRLAYESVAPGSSRVAKRSATHRRALPYRMAALLPFLPRNVWILAQRG